MLPFTCTETYTPQDTPISSSWPQLCTPHPLNPQAAISNSFPPQVTSSIRIEPLPEPNLPVFGNLCKRKTQLWEKCHVVHKWETVYVNKCRLRRSLPFTAQFFETINLTQTTCIIQHIVTFHHIISYTLSGHKYCNNMADVITISLASICEA